jgi:predicted transcriptional regulator YdeE
MIPKIIEPKEIVMTGMSFFGDPFNTHAGWDEDNQIGQLWKRLFTFLKNHPEGKRLLSRNEWYEVHLYGPETSEKGLFEVFVGVDFDIKVIAELPAELLIKHLPATQYAVFTLSGDQISSDWEKMIMEWLFASDYESNGNFGVQLYDERFKGMDRMDESILDVYVPIKKK